MGAKIRAKKTHNLTGRRPVMALIHTAGETAKVCVIILCACLYCTTDATIELLGLAGSRPAMKSTQCVVVLDNKIEIGECMFSRSLCKHSVFLEIPVR